MKDEKDPKLTPEVTIVFILHPSSFPPPQAATTTSNPNHPSIR
jgi:hypothetical protein